MTYDVAFRHAQALDPSALTTIAATLHALRAAITDCRNAGKADETDPAVVLLARHLGHVARADRPDDQALRHSCMDAIADIRRHPALLNLALRGVSYDEPAKTLFHTEGRRALQRLADALGIERGRYDLRTNKGGIAVSGEVTLHGDEIYVQLSLGCMGAGREVMFRRVSGRTDYCGERNCWASVSELLAPDRFAARIRAELRLTTPAVAAERLFA